MFFFLQVLFVLMFLFGNDFLKIGAGPFNGFFAIIVISSVIFLSYYKESFALLQKQFWLLLFCILGFVIMLLSFLGIQRLFFGVQTYPAYVLRQGYFIPLILLLLPVFSLSFGKAFFKYYNENSILEHPILTVGILVTLLLIRYDNLSANVILIIPILLLSQRFRMLALLLVIFWYIRSYQGLTNLLMLMGVVTYIVLQRFPMKKIVMIAVIAGTAGLVALGTKEVLQLRKIDPNSAWRFYVWQKNVEYSLKNTFGVGVGFGTPYFLGTRFDQLFLRLSATEGTDIEGSNDPEAMVRGQHNSLANVFYRMGIVGFSFLMMYVIQMYRKMEGLGINHVYGLALFFIVLVISTNVGLESPRTFVQFLLVIGFLIHVMDQRLFPSRPNTKEVTI